MIEIKLKSAKCQKCPQKHYLKAWTTKTSASDFNSVQERRSHPPCDVCAHKQKVLASSENRSFFSTFRGYQVITWQLLNPPLCTMALWANINSDCWPRPGGGCSRQSPRTLRVLWNADQLSDTRFWKRPELSLRDAGPGLMRGGAGFNCRLRGIMGRER